MAKILADLFGLTTTDWDEGVAAAGYLEGLRSAAGFFAKDREKVLADIFKNLSQLPDTWARELCSQVLLSRELTSKN